MSASLPFVEDNHQHGDLRGVTEDKMFEEYLQSLTDKGLKLFAKQLGEEDGKGNTDLSVGIMEGGEIFTTASTQLPTAAQEDVNLEPQVLEHGSATTETTEVRLVGTKSPCKNRGIDQAEVRRCLRCGEGECLFCICSSEGWTSDQFQQNGWVCK